jgi:class 3 adenylate cyclase
MNFEQILDAATELLQRKQRITYGALRRQFGLDEAGLEDLKQELIRGQRVARDEDGAVLVWAGAAADAAPAPTPARSEAERRQITVVFCDLADSTTMSNTLDVEELRVVLRRFQDAAGQVIARHEGFVNSYMGDGIVTLFGYPRAHEDDARRAVRAGLEIVAAVSALQGLPGGVRLRTRVGIATGTVVVGEVIGAGASREESVVGSTPNLAARLQSLAQPGEVVVSAATRKLLGRGFETVDLGAQTLKGFDVPMAVYRVRGERSTEAQFTQDDADAPLPPMVDREVEFPALMGCWRQACDGEPRIVTLRGEAGLGKSRLCEAVREAVAAGPHRLARFHCSTQFQNTALYPVIRQIADAAAIEDGEPADEKLDKLRALLERGQPASEVEAAMPYMAAMLGIATEGRYPRIVDSPERQRELTLRALRAQLLGLAQQDPVLVLFEDLHWADPSTLALIHQLAQDMGPARLMLLATARPEFEPPWAEAAPALTLELSLLKRHHRSRIVEHQSGGKALPPEILEHILQKSDGIPLYVEEITRAMIESGVLREEGDRYVLTGPLKANDVPSTLHDSLLARLDRLSSVKEVAQAGAAIGREFDYATLAAVLSLPQAELHTALVRLTESGLVFGRGLPPDAVYTFKHALVQDTAYATMLRARRQSLHARIAQVLESQGGAAPELLAHHHTAADQVEQALPHLLAAGLSASAAAAHAEACKHFDEGLRLAATLPEGPTRHAHELRLRLHMGMSLAATLGFAAHAVEACNQRARELCRLLGDTEELFWVLRGLCALYIVRRDTQACGELADQLVRLGEETRRPDYLIEAYLMLGYHSTYIGELAVGRHALQRVVALYREHAGHQIPWPTPQDPRVAAESLLAVVGWLTGQVQASQVHAAEALRAAELTGKPFDAAYAHVHVACVNNLRGDAALAARHALQAVEISQRHGFAVWMASGYMNLGYAKALMGSAAEAAEAIGMLEATLPAWRASGAELNAGYFTLGLALARRSAGQHDAALQAIQDAIAHGQQYNEHYYDALQLRIRGELKAAADPAAARQDFERAIAVARQQGAAMLELQAALALARSPGDAAATARARTALRDALLAAPAAAETREFREASAELAAPSP